MRESRVKGEGERRAKVGARGSEIRLARKMDALVEIIKMLARDVDLDDLLSLIATQTSEIMNAERSTIYLIDEAKGELCSKVAQELGVLEIRLKRGQGLAGQAWKTGRSIISHDVYSDPCFDPQFDRLTGWRTKDLVAVPMCNYEGNVMGVLEVMNHRSGHFSRMDEELLAALASAAAVALETARLRSRATQDFVTGLYNRGSFQDLYERELARAKRYGRLIAVVMMDVDGLKGINDLHGHNMGDEVLSTVGGIIKQSFRASDILARYGGDEFVALLPEAGEQEAAVCVGRLQEHLDRFNRLGALPVSVSVSMGIAAAADNHERLLELADQAMYANKKRPPDAPGR